MYNFAKMCRTCLASEKASGDGAVLAPFSGETSPKIHTGEKNIVDLIALLTDVEVNDDARYPQNICTACVADIECAYKFKLKCEQSDLYLRQQIETDKSLKPRKRSRLPKSSKQRATNSEKLLRKATITTESSTTIDANCYAPEPGPSSPKAKRKSLDQNILKNAFEHAFESDDDTNNDSSNVQYEEVYSDVIDDQLTIISSEQLANIDGAELSVVLVKDESIQEQDYLVSEIENISEDYNLNDFDENLQLDCVKEEPQLHTTNYSKDRIVAPPDENSEPQIIPVAGENFNTNYDMRMLNTKCSCNSCKIEFDGIVQYKEHFIEEHTQGQLCKICEKEFISNMWSHAGRHLWSHGATNKRNKAGLQRCNICSKEVKALYQHQRIHSESRPFGCDICTHRFKSRSHLIQHLSFGHRTKCKPNCRLCKFSEDLKNI